MLKRTVMVLLVVIAAAAIVEGCGDDESSAGSGGDGTIETSSLTKAQFIKNAGAICTESNENLLNEINAYIEKHKSPSKSEGEEMADALRELAVPKVETQIEEIENLGAPAGDEAQIEAFLEAQRHSVKSLAARQSLTLTPGLETVFREPGKLARRYGLDECAYG